MHQQAQAILDEFEASRVIEEVDQFETSFLERQTTRELSSAGGLALGLAILHSTAKALLPARVAGTVVGGAWVLGGAFVVFRLTASTVAGWAAQTERNIRRKKRLTVS